ncbi:hypothetical protein H8E88_11925 [candidate division KSB1 bacterium]|nr:hypothetical protein [candidate division KSB1 bacterium]
MGAIDAASTQNGHTVVACPGIYRENVVINKSITLGSKEGRDVTTIYAEDKTKPAIKIVSDNARVHGFTVNNGWGPSSAGILIINYQGITISGCKFMQI